MTDNWGDDNVHISSIFDEGKGYFIMNVSESTPAEDTLNNGEGQKAVGWRIKRAVKIGPLL
jgi:hypothetical protein